MCNENENENEIFPCEDELRRYLNTHNRTCVNNIMEWFNGSNFDQVIPPYTERELRWQLEHLAECGYISFDNDVVEVIDVEYFRP